MHFHCCRVKYFAVPIFFGRIPVRVALGALLFYVLTLSHGVTLESLPLTAKLAGWDWVPMTGQPLLWLLTLPLRVLPAAWVPAGLNLFSAISGALTLGLLARSLELLPWPRPLETLNAWTVRLPLLLAVAACGLEFNFWQAATAGTGEMLDVLLLATALWCGLEYGVVRNIRWLQAAALVWGAGMAETWVMLLTLPVFVGALVWLLKRRVYRLKIILPLAGLGLAGFLIYLLPPMANGLMPGSPWDLGTAWIYSLKATKSLLLAVYGQFWVRHRMITLAVLLFYLLPIAACLLRLRDETTKNKSWLERWQIWALRGFRAVIWLACVWLAFDPAIGPRGIITQQFNFSLPLLSFDYLNGLAIGFLSGHFLLIRLKTSRRGVGGGLSFAQLWGQISGSLTLVVLGLVVLGLVVRNAPVIRLTNRQPLTQFGALDSLPPGGGIIVSDFTEKLLVFQAAQAGRPDRAQWLPVDIRCLPVLAYRQRLERVLPGNWLKLTNRQDLTVKEVQQMLDVVATSNRVFYLQPGSGVLFERFYPQPAGLVFELKRLEAPHPSPLAAATLRQNEKFWDDMVARLQSTPVSGGLFESSPARTFETFFRLVPAVARQNLVLNEWYSMGLNTWGVELQRNGLLPGAQVRFNQALTLNSNNWVARINLGCNSNLQAGTKMTLANAANLFNESGSLQNFSQIMSRLGPLDEPGACYRLGTDYQHAGMFRLALRQFDRAHTLAPDPLVPQFALAQLYVRYRMNDQAMATINHLRGQIEKLPDRAKLGVELSLLEADAWLAQSNYAGAVSVLHNVVQQHPDDAEILKRISQAYFVFGDLTNAAQVVTSLLDREPDNVPALMIQSGIFLQARQADRAIPVLNHILALTNHPSAKLARGMAYAEIRNYPAARADFLDLENSLPNGFLAESGLAQLAELQHDTNQAVYYLKLCLSNAPPKNVPEIRARLDSLQPTPPKG